MLSQQVARQSVQHVPDEEGWGRLMQPLHDALATSSIRTDRLPELHQVCTLPTVCAERESHVCVLLDGVAYTKLPHSDTDPWQWQW